MRAWDQPQAICPSTVAGATGVAVPKKTAHVIAPAAGLEATADHPPAVASGIAIETPGEER